MSQTTAAAGELHDVYWFAARIGKSRAWVLRHLDKLPHYRIGHSLRFDQGNVDEVLSAALRRPEPAALASAVTSVPTPPAPAVDPLAPSRRSARAHGIPTRS